MFEEPAQPADFSDRRQPRTITVVGVILAASLAFSYLIAYPVLDALSSHGVISPASPAARDETFRLRCMVYIFIGTMALLMSVAALFRWASGRQMSRIDAIADADDSPES
jgi:hypothetical protein